MCTTQRVQCLCAAPTPRAHCRRRVRFGVFHVPSGEATVFDVAFRICRPLTIHFISAGGFDGAVVHCNGTMSPTLASVAPVIET